MTCNEPLLYVLIFKFSLGLLNLGINTYTSTILKFLNTGVIFNLGKLLLNAERKEKYRMRKNAKVIPSSEKRRKKKQKLMQWLENFIIFSLNCPLNILWPSRTVVKKIVIKKMADVTQHILFVRQLCRQYCQKYETKKAKALKIPYWAWKSTTTGVEDFKTLSVKSSSSWTLKRALSVLVVFNPLAGTKGAKNLPSKSFHKALFVAEANWARLRLNMANKSNNVQE